MAWHPDFAPYPDVPLGMTHEVLAVGWLKNGHSFPNGPVDAAVLQRLRELVVDPWQLPERPGKHTCDLCDDAFTTGSATVWLPAFDVVFVCPILITHFIEKHHYRPPSEFCEAVLTCPPMDSDRYFEALRIGAPAIAWWAVDRQTLGDRIRVGTGKGCSSSREREQTWASREVMIPYPGAKDRQWVIGYRLGADFIKLRFHNEFVLVFTFEQTGREHVNALKKRAVAKSGLEEYLRQERPRGRPDSPDDPDRAAMMYTARKRGE